jgi:hypothetical protein
MRVTRWTWDEIQVSVEERAAMRYVEGLKGFYYHIAGYLLVVAELLSSTT